MYKKFYGLTRNPFEVSPDPYFFFQTPRHTEALANLAYGVLRRKGFVVVTGEVGTGKTLLVRCVRAARHDADLREPARQLARRLDVRTQRLDAAGKRRVGGIERSAPPMDGSVRLDRCVEVVRDEEGAVHVDFPVGCS